MGEEALYSVPLHVLARIAAQGKVVAGITPRRSVLLYTDISGFTPLTEAFTLKGKEGIEEVTEILNLHFERLSGILGRNQGILLKMGGDSLLASFADSDAVERGKKAAWEMLDWFKENPVIATPQGEFPLSMKAILGGGDYFEAILGAQDKNDWFILGRVPEELARAEKSVQPGEFLIKKGLADEVFTKEAYPSIPVLNRQELENLTASFQPSGRQSRLALTSGGEYRVVAPVFLNLQGYDMNKPDFNALNSFYLDLSRLLAEYHGVVNKIDIAPQGSTFLLLFGAPTSHRDDRSNAACFFRELAALKTSFQLKAGLSYGSVFAGFIGGTQKEYTVIGQRVNTAAKVMAASRPGEFVLSEEAAEKLSDIYDVQKLEPVVLSGTSYPRYQLGERKEVAEDTWETHLEELEQVAALAKGPSLIVGVSGDHGMGKTRFLKRIGTKLRPTHKVLEVSLEERQAPYQVFRRILMSEAGVKEEESQEAKRVKLRAHLDKVSKAQGLGEQDELVRRFAFIASMLFGLEAEKQKVASYSPELRVENLMDAFRIYLTRLSGQAPLALLVDDLARADSGSLEMLAFTCRTLARLKPEGIYFFFAYDPEFASAFNEGFDVPSEKRTEIVLKPLSRIELREFSEHILGGKASEAVSEFLYERSLGNPTVMEQWAGYLVDKELIARSGDEWIMGAEVSASEIPDDLYSLVFSRLDRLPEQTRQVLKVGAVYGMHFPASVISRVTGSGDLGNLLAPAVRAGLVYSLEAGEVEFVFNQTLIRDVCYDSLLRGERERFHGEIVRALEKLYPESLDRYLAVLAHHAIQSGDWERGFNYSLSSARENRRLFRNEAAVEDYSGAIRIWEEQFGEGRSEELYSAYFGRGQVYEYAGMIQEALKDYDEARMLAIKIGLAEQEVDALNKLAYVSRYISDYDHLFEYVGDAFKRSVSLGYKKGLSVAYLERGTGYAKQGRNEEAELDFKTALTLSNELHDSENANRALHNLATLNRSLGDYKTALDYYKEAITIAGKSEDKLLLANNLVNISRLLAQIGKPQESESYLERALKTAMEIGHRETIIKCTLELSGLAMMRGDFERASQILAEAATRAEELENPQWKGEVEMRLGHIDFYTGRMEEASVHYKKALQMRKLMGDPNLLADTYVNLGNALQVLWRMDEALTNLLEAYKLFSETGNPVGAVQSLIALSVSNIHLGRFEDGINQAAQALATAPETADKWIEMDAKLQMASVNLTQSRYQKVLDDLGFVDDMEESPQTVNVLLHSLVSRAGAYAGLGRFSDGLKAADRALEIAERNQNPEQLFTAKSARLSNLIGLGQVETAIEELIDFEQLGRELGSIPAQVSTRIMAARINLANSMYSACSAVLEGLEKEYGDRMGEMEHIDSGLILLEARLGEKAYRQAKKLLEALEERLTDKPLSASLVSAHLLGASIYAGKLTMVSDKQGRLNPSFLARIFHPVACMRWNRHQKQASLYSERLLAELSTENAEALRRYLAAKGLDQKRI